MLVILWSTVIFYWLEESVPVLRLALGAFILGSSRTTYISFRELVLEFCNHKNCRAVCSKFDPPFSWQPVHVQDSQIPHFDITYG